jgi:hypothetical protein
MTPEPLIISPESGPGSRAVRATTLVIEDWTADGADREVAPLHVHHADDEAWHVVSGALRHRTRAIWVTALSHGFPEPGGPPVWAVG